MIRILFFIEYLSFGGAEKVLASLVNSMDRKRFDITVQTLFREDHEKYLAEGIHYRYCYSCENRRSRIRKRLEAAAGLTYRKYIKDDYDIEVAFLECGATKIMAASTNSKAARIAWVHCDLITAFGKNAASFAGKTRRYYARYDHVVCVSEQTRKSFVRLFGDRPPSSVIYNSVNDREILKLGTAPLPPEAETGGLVILTAGRLVPPKNMLRLIRSVHRLLEEGYDLRLWILGEGPERPDLEEYIRRYSLEKAVRLWGFQPNPYPFISAASLLACSSVSEGFSTFITEGLILGRPVVATDVSGMRELLGDSEYGLITENEDHAFYEGLRKMVSDPSLLEYYTCRSAERGRQFCGTVLTKKTEVFLESILKGKRND